MVDKTDDIITLIQIDQYRGKYILSTDRVIIEHEMARIQSEIDMLTVKRNIIQTELSYWKISVFFTIFFFLLGVVLLVITNNNRFYLILGLILSSISLLSMYRVKRIDINALRNRELIDEEILLKRGELKHYRDKSLNF